MLCPYCHSGEAAKSLHEAMKLHAPKHDEVSVTEYFGTKNNAMQCYDHKGDYACYIGYDAVANVLSQGKSCQYQ
jgi:hypothetical protein